MSKKKEVVPVVSLSGADGEVFDVDHFISGYRRCMSVKTTGVDSMMVEGGRYIYGLLLQELPLVADKERVSRCDSLLDRCCEGLKQDRAGSAAQYGRMAYLFDSLGADAQEALTANKRLRLLYSELAHVVEFPRVGLKAGSFHLPASALADVWSWALLAADAQTKASAEVLRDKYAPPQKARKTAEEKVKASNERMAKKLRQAGYVVGGEGQGVSGEGVDIVTVVPATVDDCVVIGWKFFERFIAADHKAGGDPLPVCWARLLQRLLVPMSEVGQERGDVLAKSLYTLPVDNGQEIVENIGRASDLLTADRFLRGWLLGVADRVEAVPLLADKEEVESEKMELVEALTADVLGERRLMPDNGVGVNDDVTDTLDDPVAMAVAAA